MTTYINHGRPIKVLGISQVYAVRRLSCYGVTCEASKYIVAVNVYVTRTIPYQRPRVVFTNT
jgi:hypothetical protein